MSLQRQLSEFPAQQHPPGWVTTETSVYCPCPKHRLNPKRIRIRTDDQKRIYACNKCWDEWLRINDANLRYRRLTNEEQSIVVIERVFERLNNRFKAIPPGNPLFTEQELLELKRALLVLYGLKIPRIIDDMIEGKKVTKRDREAVRGNNYQLSL